MNDFSKRVEQRQKEFDRDWQRARKWYWLGTVIVAIFWMTMTGFFVWVVLMVMNYFGVI